MGGIKGYLCQHHHKTLLASLPDARAVKFMYVTVQRERERERERKREKERGYTAWPFRSGAGFTCQI